MGELGLLYKPRAGGVGAGGLEAGGPEKAKTARAQALPCTWLLEVLCAR